MNSRQQPHTMDDLTEPIMLGPGVELPADLASRVKAELGPGERLLWAGTTNPTATESGSGLFVAAGVCATAWLVGLVGLAGPAWIFAADRGAIAMMTVIGLLGVIVGFGVLLGMVGNGINNAFEARRERRRPNAYALTDRRAILWQRDGQGRGYLVNSLPFDRVIHIHRIENDLGTGDVIFTLDLDAHALAMGRFGPTAIERVADVRRVEALAREAASSPRPLEPATHHAFKPYRFDSLDV